MKLINDLCGLFLVLRLVSGRLFVPTSVGGRKLDKFMPQSKLPVLFYGFPQNTSVLDSEYQLEIDGQKTLSCPKGLKILVHKAILHCDSDLNCTEIIRSKCLQKETCSVHPRDCMKAPCKTPTCSLEYTCELAKEPRPLYNGSGFTEGVFPDFLILQKDGKAPLNPPTTQLKRCNQSESCKYVIQGSDDLYTDDFDKINSNVFVKHNQFLLPGYAVLLNYAGICNKPVYPKARAFYEVAKEANPLTFRSFSIGYTPSSLFNLDPRKNVWLCKGMPTIVPVAGHVTAIRVW